MALLQLHNDTDIDGVLRPAGMFFEIPVNELTKAIRLVETPPVKGRGRPKRVEKEEA